MSSWKAVVASCLIGWLCAAVTAWAQSPQQPVPRFRSGVDLVAVDVSVVDRDGQPVGDLTVEDFSITVDGSPRRLVSAAFIPLGADARPSPAPAAPEAGTEPAPAFSSTNEGAVGGRLILFVVDRGNIRAGEGRRLFEAAGTFIDRLGPADRVALAVVPGGGPNVEFTADGGLVKTALQTVVGGATPLLTNHSVGLTEALAIHRQDLTTRERVVQRECRLAQDPDALKKCRMEVLAEARLAYLNWRQQASASLVALRELLARLALIGGPKTMVVLTGGMFVDAWEGSELDTIADAAARADATLYTFGLDVDRADAATAEVSPTYEADRLLVRQGLERLAGEAGGVAFSVATGAATAFDRLGRELSGYYLLSFEPAPGDDDGKPHRIGVDVRRGGVEVRTRRHFLTASASGSEPAGEVPASPGVPAEPGGDTRREPGPADIAGVEPFDRLRVLDPAVVGYFLDRLPAEVAESPSMPVAALDAARRGAFDEIDRALAGAAASGPAVELLGGLARLARGEIAPAARAFGEAARLAPALHAARFYLGACHAVAGRDAEAAAAWQAASIADTEGAFVFEVLADALLRQREGPLAADVLTEARLLWPDEPGFARRLAVAEALAHRQSAAIAALDEYLAMRQDDANAQMLGAWLVYDARRSDRPLGSLEDDLARLGRYRERYVALGGAEASLIDEWADALKRKS